MSHGVICKAQWGDLHVKPPACIGFNAALRDSVGGQIIGCRCPAVALLICPLSCGQRITVVYADSVTNHGDRVILWFLETNLRNAVNAGRNLANQTLTLSRSANL